MKSVNWVQVVIFYVIAVGVSAPFRLGYIKPEEYLSLPYGLNSLYTVLRGIGPAVGFFILFYILKSKTERQITFWGTKKIGSLIAIIPIPFGFCLFGIPNSLGLEKHYYGFVYGVTFVLYSLGEEFGWRGYLQQALAPMKTIHKILLISVLWYLWHLNFFSPDFTLKTHLIHFSSIVLGTWGLLRITEMTKSILFAAAVHLSFNLFTDVKGEFFNRFIILSISVIIWIVLLKTIYKTEKSTI